MSREAFEKWAQGKSLLLNIREELMYAAGYINVKEMAWEAWQAAQAQTLLEVIRDDSGCPVEVRVADALQSGELMVTKTQISEAIFGWGLRNDDGHNLSMDDTDEIAEYIVTRTPQPVVPEGYVLVPVEPTEAMLMAWFSATRESSEGVGTLGYFRAAYKALLSAGKEDV
jgi:hypothetical protein